jgi:plasmid stabilization system protein ParE
MARRKAILVVEITATADRDLMLIWDFNAQTRGHLEADRWDSFLRTTIEKLTTDYDRGRSVGNAPEIRFITARKRPKAHGHIVVFQIDYEAMRIRILHIFHTSQDWQNKL